MNSYLDALQPAAETAIWPLARKATALAKQLAAIQHRAGAEMESIAGTDARLAELKADAGQRLTESAQSYGRFKTELRVLTARLETSRETVRMFDAELIPAKTRELSEARRAVEDGLITFVAANLVDCERRMGELIGVVLEERSAFMAAVDAIATRFMGHELAGSKRVYPEPMHLRPDVYRPAMLVATTLNEAIFDSDAPRHKGAYLAQPPAPATVPDAPQDVQDVVETRESGPRIDADGRTRPQPRTLLTGETAPPEPAPDFISGKPAVRDYGPAGAAQATQDEAQDAALFDAAAPDAEAPAPLAADVAPAGG